MLARVLMTFVAVTLWCGRASNSQDSPTESETLLTVTNECVGWCAPLHSWCYRFLKNKKILLTTTETSSPTLEYVNIETIGILTDAEAHELRKILDSPGFSSANVAYMTTSDLVDSAIRTTIVCVRPAGRKEIVLTNFVPIQRRNPRIAGDPPDEVIRIIGLIDEVTQRKRK